ncbi:MAG: sugar-binding protein [Treponema sp.]|nr:sugar-binding protein [Treponema sp.]
MRKLLTIFAAALLVSVILVGCQRRGTGELIGIAMPETHVERWVKDGNQLRDSAVRRGYRAEVQWADANQAVQNQQIQSFITQGAKGLVIGNINDGVGSVVLEAAREGIAIVAYDRIIQNSTDYDYFLTFNNFKVGVLQAESLVAGMNLDAATSANPRLITLFAGSPTDANAFFFYDGAMSVLNPYVDRGVLRVIGPYPRTSADRANFQRIATENWMAPIARARMDNLLTNEARDVTLNAVLAPNDTLARAIIEALIADAKYANNLPVVSGQDAEFDSMMSIRNGQQYSTVFKDTALLADAAILLLDQVLKGEAINIPGAELATGALREIGNTGTGYVQAYLLDPILVTSDNIRVPVDAGFFTSAQAAQLR